MSYTKRDGHDLFLYADGLERFNRRQFFSSHEPWEDLWLRNRSEMREFLQGLIQLAAAFHHLERQNLVGMLALLTAARRRLGAYAPEAFGLKVASLLLEIESAEAHARGLGPARLALFDPELLPRLQYDVPSLPSFKPHCGSVPGPARKRDWLFDRAMQRDSVE